MYVKDVYAYWEPEGIPPTVMEATNMPPRDKGIDLIVETHEGNYWAIQVKYRSNPTTKLKWGEELATFESLYLRNHILCPKLNRGILFTNTYGCPDHYNTEELWSTYVHNDIIDSRNVLPALHELNGIASKRIKRSPRSYQTEMLISSNTLYQTQSRGKLVAPCGSGKTLDSVWIVKQYLQNGTVCNPHDKGKEKCDSPCILVVLPTLDLVGQYMHTFLDEFPTYHNKVWITLVIACQVTKKDQH